MSQLGLSMTDERSGSPRRRRHHKRRQRRHRVRNTFAVLAALAVLGGIVYGGYSGLKVVAGKLSPQAAEDYPGPGSGEVTIRVEQGDAVRVIGQRLEEAGVVASTAAFLEAAAEEPDSTGIQPGSYVLKERMAAADALAVLIDPAQRQLARVTIPEGRPLDEALSIMAERGGLDLDELTAVADSPAGIGLPEYAEGNLEGFLFPATYEVEDGSTERDVVATAVARYLQAAEEVGLVKGADRLGLTPREVLVVASLIEAEAAREEDRPKVARVIYNRLAAGMPLQLDSTVNYATGEDGITTSDEARDSDSPYNTYKVAGLPPGPINSPGEAAMAAALAPADGDWIYFVTVNPDTGETKFTASDEEHLRNVEEFRAWLREQG